MPVKLPKYAHWVAERRFLVDASLAPTLDGAGARRIEDLYIQGGRLRLRAITHLATGEREFKLAKKYAPDKPLIGPVLEAIQASNTDVALEACANSGPGNGGNGRFIPG